MNNSYDDNLQKGWLGKLEAGLTKSSLSLTNSLNELLVKKKLDSQTLEEIEDVLITADLGVETARKISKKLASTRFGKDANPTEVRRVVADEIIEILSPVAQPLSLNPTNRPHVILVCGVNGSGKTTTVGKLAHKFGADGQHVMLAAGDTFRAAATEQLKIWGERAACPVISKETGSDPAGLVFEAFQKARRDSADVLLIDTAGRLQNNTELMEELQKIIRVVQRFDKTAPHSCLLVLDATVGQNAHSQVEIFLRMVNVTGLILTKIDGSAKGGVLVSLAQKNGLPVHAIGVGEQPDDLQNFSATDFALSLLDIKT